jgi:hypothetical protein
MNKTIGQLIKENHWSTRRLAVAMNITQADLTYANGKSQTSHTRS